MATGPASSDVQRVYATMDDLAPLVAPSTISGPTAQGDVLITQNRVQEALKRFSRIIDARLAGTGVRTPFPDVGNSNPGPPRIVRDWVMYRTAAEVALWNSLGNSKAPQVVELLALAHEILSVDESGRVRGAILGDALLEYVHNETFELTTTGGASEWGQIGSTTRYRLRNPGLVYDPMHPLKFVNASNAEVFASDGRPFSTSNGWWVVDAAQSIIQIARRTEIENLASYVNYWFTWWNLGRFVPQDNVFESGVAHYAP